MWCESSLLVSCLYAWEDVCGCDVRAATAAAVRITITASLLLLLYSTRPLPEASFLPPSLSSLNKGGWGVQGGVWERGRLSLPACSFFSTALDPYLRHPSFLPVSAYWIKGAMEMGDGGGGGGDPDPYVETGVWERGRLSRILLPSTSVDTNLRHASFLPVSAS